MKNLIFKLLPNLQIGLILGSACMCSAAVAVSSNFRNELFHDFRTVEGYFVNTNEGSASGNQMVVHPYKIQSVPFSTAPSGSGVSAVERTDYNSLPSGSDGGSVSIEPYSSSKNEESKTDPKGVEDSHGSRGEESAFAGSESSLESRPFASRHIEGQGSAPSDLLTADDGTFRNSAPDEVNVAQQQNDKFVPPSQDPDIAEVVPAGDVTWVFMLLIMAYALWKFCINMKIKRADEKP